MKYFIKILFFYCWHLTFCQASPLTVIAQAIDEATLKALTAKESDDLVFSYYEPQEHLGVSEHPWERLEKLKSLYQKKLKKFPKWPRIPCNGIKKIELNTSDPIVPILRKQLHYHDLIDTKKLSSPIFDERVQQALKEFQKNHFLEPDGVIGPKTCQALNLSLKKRLKKINKNLARWEEIKPLMDGRYILINIPTFFLYAMTDEQINIRQPVVVGRINRKTPLIQTSINSIVLNPSWGVPVSIFVKDKLKKTITDPTYLDERNYIILDQDGQQISYEDVDWETLSEDYFPYRIVQLPGGNNALGNIKFNMDNKDAIYLHSTPDTRLFQRIKRTFSSGCVRLSDPFALANWALENKSKKYNYAWLTKKVKDGETKTIPVKPHIPVYFVYITVWINDSGQPQWSDPYDYD